MRSEAKPGVAAEQAAGFGFVFSKTNSFVAFFLFLQKQGSHVVKRSSDNQRKTGSIGLSTGRALCLGKALGWALSGRALKSGAELAEFSLPVGEFMNFLHSTSELRCGGQQAGHGASSLLSSLLQSAQSPAPLHQAGAAAHAHPVPGVPSRRRAASLRS